MSQFENFASENTETPKEETKKEKKTVARKVDAAIGFNEEVDIEDLDTMISHFEPLQDIEYPYNHGYGITTIWGDTKQGKTIMGLAHPGNILAMGYESHANLFNAWEGMFSKNKRIQIKSFDQFISEASGEAKKISSNEVFNATMKLMQNARKLEKKFEWGLFDGLQNLLLICEMRMRIEHEFGWIEGFAERTIWRVRTMFMNQILREAMKTFSKGVIFTSQDTVQKEIKGGKETGVVKQPAWKGKIKELTQTELFMSRDILDMPDGTKRMTFDATGVCKLSGWSGTQPVTVLEDEGTGPISLLKIIYDTKPKFKIE